MHAKKASFQRAGLGELQWADKHVKAESLRVVRERAMWELSKLVTAAPSCSQGQQCCGVSSPGCTVSLTSLLESYSWSYMSSMLQV